MAPTKTRYKVEYCTPQNVWKPLHRRYLRSYRSALAMKQAFSRILVDWMGNGVWEEINTHPGHTPAWENEKRAALAEQRSLEVNRLMIARMTPKEKRASDNIVARLAARPLKTTTP